LHSSVDQVDNLFAKRRKPVLVLDREGATLPAVANLVEHGSDHSNQDVDRSAVRGNGFLDDAFGPAEIALETGLEQIEKDAAQEDGVSEFAGCKKIRVFRFAIQAQSVRVILKSP
jgi:hypothetical protein